MFRKLDPDAVSEMFCSLVFRIADDGQSPKTQEFWDLF
jgi:hypothetical protein